MPTGLFLILFTRRSFSEGGVTQHSPLCEVGPFNRFNQHPYLQQFCEKIDLFWLPEWAVTLFFHFYAFAKNETNLKFNAPTLQCS